MKAKEIPQIIKDVGFDFHWSEKKGLEIKYNRRGNGYK